MGHAAMLIRTHPSRSERKVFAAARAHHTVHTEFIYVRESTGARQADGPRGGTCCCVLLEVVVAVVLLAVR